MSYYSTLEGFQAMSQEQRMNQLRLAARSAFPGPVSNDASDLYIAMMTDKPRVLYRTIDDRWALSGGWHMNGPRYWSESAVRELVDQRLIFAPWDAPRDSWYELATGHDGKPMKPRERTAV